MIAKKFAFLLAAAATFAGCAASNSNHVTLEQKMRSRVTRLDTASTTAAEPPPPAEGPEDTERDAPDDLRRNPGLVPSPLLRDIAASHP